MKMINYRCTAIFLAVVIHTATGYAQQMTTSSVAASAETPATLVNALLPLPAGSNITLVGPVSTEIRTEDDRPNTPDPVLFSSEDSMGTFANGNIVPDTILLDDDNQNDDNDAKFSGGIGIESGVVLCSAVVSDAYGDDPANGLNVPDGRGVGVEGPNNGFQLTDVNAGEISVPTLGVSCGGTGPNNPERLAHIDEDFSETVLDLYEIVTAIDCEPPFDRVLDPRELGGGDPVVLDFQVVLATPGIITIDYVFASDEYPDYILAEFNDSFGILIRQDSLLPREPRWNLKSSGRNNLGNRVRVGRVRLSAVNGR